jgi:hypothetical protein
VAKDSPVTGVLADTVADLIDGRRVRAAVFTTFSFDPGFFELYVAPLLFPDRAFSHQEKARWIQLAGALDELRALSVYYDRSALSQDALPPRLEWERNDLVRKVGGFFHPKLVLILVENEAPELELDEPVLSLIVGTLSANLTRSGWWENVEAAHFEEIHDERLSTDRWSFRPDLLTTLRHLENAPRTDSEQTALHMVQEFLAKRVNKKKFKHRKFGGRYFTRLFCGQDQLARWLEEKLDLEPDTWNLEIVSPYFDEGHASTLGRLIEGTRAKAVRVYLPLDSEGQARVSRATHDAVAEFADWSNLPGPLTQRSSGARQQKLAPRRVHAKVYRLWAKGQGEIILVGSVNLTSPGHSKANAGNFEAAFLVHNEAESRLTWWLEPRDAAPADFRPEGERENDVAVEIPVQIALRFDWRTKRLEHFLEEKADALELWDPNGSLLLELEQPKQGCWVDCGDEASLTAETLLIASSFLLVKHPDGEWRILVRELGMGFKPSLLSQLTPEEILQYWALLSPAQQQAFILDKLGRDADLEGLSQTGGKRFLAGNTLFDRFAGIFRAFGCLQRRVEEAIAAERWNEVEARLFGARYDSLPSLLDKVLESEGMDPVNAYVTFLCAEQIHRRLRRDHGAFLKERKSLVRQLLDRLEKLSEIRAKIGLSDEEADTFFAWYERAFLADAPALPEPVQ